MGKCTALTLAAAILSHLEHPKKQRPDSRELFLFPGEIKYKEKDSVKRLGERQRWEQLSGSIALKNRQKV